MPPRSSQQRPGQYAKPREHPAAIPDEDQLLSGCDPLVILQTVDQSPSPDLF